MKIKITRVITTLSFLGALIGINLSPLVASAATDTCTWTGASSNNWSDTGNWTGCNGNIPTNGENDFVVFPNTATTKTPNNDMSGLTVGAIIVTGDNFTISGNALTVTASGGGTANLALSGTGNTISLPLTLSAFNSNSTIGDGNNTISGSITYALGGGMFWDQTGDTGTVTLTGAQSGSIGSVFGVENGGNLIMNNGSANTFVATNGVLISTSSTYTCFTATCLGDSSNTAYEWDTSKYVLDGSFTLANDFHLNQGDLASVKTLEAANGTVVLSGTITLVGDTEIAADIGSSSLELLGAMSIGAHNLTISGTNNTNSRFYENGSGITGSGTITCQTILCTFGTDSTAFTGVIDAKSGSVIQPGEDQSLGTTAGNTIIEDGASLWLSVGPHSYAEPISVSGTGAGAFAGGIYDDTSTAATLTGPITLTGDTTIENVGNSTLHLQSSIGGTGDLTLHVDTFGSNETILENSSANTFNGSLIITGGQIALNSNNAVPGNITFNATDPIGDNAGISMGSGTTNAIADTSVLNFMNGGFLGTNGASDTIGGLAGVSSADIRLINAADTLTIDQAINTTYAGLFEGNGSVVKTGTGTLLLTGSTNVDPMAFTVSAGALSVNGDQHVNSFIVNGGTLKGNGTTGDITATTGKIAPGNSPGTLHVTGATTLSAGATYQEEIAGTTAGSQYDQLIATGVITLGNAQLSIVPSYTPTAGTVFTIMQGSSISGIFAGLADGATVTVNGLQFRVNYTSTTVTLTFLGGTLSPSATTGGGSLVNTGADVILMEAASLLMIGIVIILTRIKVQTYTLPKSAA